MKRAQSIFSLACAVVLLALVMIGCLPFPLGDPQHSTVDPKLQGLWYFDDADRPMLIAIYPFDEHTYAVRSRDFRKEAGRLEPAGGALWKAWLTDVKGRTFITLDPLAQHLDAGTVEKKAYPVFQLVRDGQTIKARRVNEDFEPMKQVKNAQEEADLIAREIDNPSLYAGEPATFRHLDPEKDKALIEQVMANER